MSYVIVNRNGERMYQFPVFGYLDLAERVCERNRLICPNAGFRVVEFDV